MQRGLFLTKKHSGPRQARISHVWTRPPTSNPKAQDSQAPVLLLRYLGVTPLNAWGCWLPSPLASLIAVWGEIEARVPGKSSQSYQDMIHLNTQVLLKLLPAISRNSPCNEYQPWDQSGSSVSPDGRPVYRVWGITVCHLWHCT